MIYYRCYIEAYDDATADLSMLHDGAYGRLLRYYYRKEKPLPLDSDSLARICSAISLEERAAIAAVLDRFFIREADGWHNERADEEIAVANTARANGSRGGRPAKAQTESETTDETESESAAETETETKNETERRTGSGHPSSLLTKTILLPSQPTTQPPSARASRSGPPVDTGAIWSAYSQAHRIRYGVDPARNARVNGQLATVVRCLGAENAPAVASFFVRHNRSDYVKNSHRVGLLARDAESLYTEWQRGQRVSETEARQADRTMATSNAFAPLIEQARRG